MGGERFNVCAYYEDTDAVGVVYHAGYLQSLEREALATVLALGATPWQLTCR